MTRHQQHHHVDDVIDQEATSVAFRTPYAPNARLVVGLSCPELPFGRTKQAFKDESDINWIMAKYDRTGVLDYVQQHGPQFSDLSQIDFREAFNQVLEAQAAFDDLPAKIRDRFDNDPANLISFLEDPQNRSEAALLGLIREEATLLAPDPRQPAGEAPRPDSGPVSKSA